MISQFNTIERFRAGCAARLVLAAFASAAAGMSVLAREVPVGAPKGTSRTIVFTTSEGTAMSVDVSPDGQDLAFDLLGHLYRMRATGGQAHCLTQGSGIALNYHPRFSPDGQSIAFVSDRSGQANLWVMRADGSDARAVYLDDHHRYATPVWSADGTALFATRLGPTPGQAWHRRSASIWRLPLRGSPTPVLVSTKAQYYVSSIAPDGRTLYLYSSIMAAEGASILETDFRLQALDLVTGRIRDIRRAASEQAVTATDRAALSGATQASAGPADKVAEIVPIASPDGRTLAFARAQRVPGGRIGRHSYEGSTALFVMDVRTGAVRRILDSITHDLTEAIAHFSDTFLPAFSWTPDSEAVVISAGGRIVRVPLDGSRVREVPFTANVYRDISEQVLGKVHLDPDDSVPVRFVQWPTASADGRTLVFAALGRLWRMELPGGQPQPLTPDSDADIQITPTWSPDGSEVAFATWNAKDRGHIWRFDIRKRSLTRVSTQPGEYIWPTWVGKGDIVAVRGPGAPDNHDGWSAPTGWTAVRLSQDGDSEVLTSVGSPWQPLHSDSNGRVRFSAQWDSTVANRIELPFPTASELELGAWHLMSVDSAGEGTEIDAMFPAGPSSAAVPVVSSDGLWLAYQADYQIFVERLPGRLPGRMAMINPDPGVSRLGRQRADLAGGAYARWRNERVLEFAAGNHYVTFDVVTGARHSVPIDLRFRRDRNPASLAIRNVRIITMEHDQVIEQGAIVVRDGRIACVGACMLDGIEWHLDLSGKTAIPGLIDVHDHIAFEANGVVARQRPRSQLALAYGVTTVVDPAVSATTLFPLAEMTDAGRSLGPRIFGAAEGVFSSSGGVNGAGSVIYGALLEIGNAADAEYQVARRSKQGAVIIKNYRLATRRQQQWLIGAARKHGISVTAEGGSLLMDLGMIMDGQTGWEHFIPALPLYNDVAEFMGRAHATYSPTLSVAGFPQGAMNYYRQRADLAADAKFKRFASRELLSSVQASKGTAPLKDFAFPVLAEGAAAIVRAGGFATIGAHGENPGIGSHWEVWAYATAMDALAALRAATLSGARFAGLDQELGSIRVGKLADLIILNKDPRDRIENTADIAYVMKGGRLYNGSTLVEVDSASN